MTFEQMERAMEFMLEQQARTDARLDKTGELLNVVGLRLDTLAADAVTFRDDIIKVQDEFASARDVAISHNQAIHQLFKLHEQTQKNFESLHQQRKDDFELHQQNFELLDEQREKDIEITRKKLAAADELREKDIETTRKKFAAADEQRKKDVEAVFDLIKQLTHKIDSLADALTKPGQNGRQ